MGVVWPIARPSYPTNGESPRLDLMRTASEAVGRLSPTIRDAAAHIRTAAGWPRRVNQTGGPPPIYFTREGGYRRYTPAPRIDRRSSPWGGGGPAQIRPKRVQMQRGPADVGGCVYTLSGASGRRLSRIMRVIAYPPYAMYTISGRIIFCCTSSAPKPPCRLSPKAHGLSGGRMGVVV